MAVLLAVWCLAAPLGAQDGLSAAQALYADARYEDALKAFDALKAAGGQAPARTALAIEQGRALCLLALDRGADAQQAIETILHLDPSFKPTEDDTSPKIRTVFRDVRRRALAGVLQEVYERAKQAYERKAYDEAVVGFGQVLALLDDPDLVLDAGPRARHAARRQGVRGPRKGGLDARAAGARRRHRRRFAGPGRRCPADRPPPTLGGAAPAGARGGAATEPALRCGVEGRHRARPAADRCSHSRLAPGGPCRQATSSSNWSCPPRAPSSRRPCASLPTRPSARWWRGP